MKNFLKTMGIALLLKQVIPTSHKMTSVVHTYYREYSTYYKNSLFFFSIILKDSISLSTYKHP